MPRPYPARRHVLPYLTPEVEVIDDACPTGPSHDVTTRLARRLIDRMPPAVIAAALVLVAACGVFERQVTDTSVVARAAGHEVTVRELAIMVAPARYLSPRIEIAERWAWWWVEYTLFAERVAAGDSLLDSATVLESRWPHIRNAMVDSMYALRAIEQRIDAEQNIDSVFVAGDLVWVDQIMIRAPADLPDGERAAKRREARRVWDRLKAGESWMSVSRLATDGSDETMGASIGVIGRGSVDPDFERAAFALGPGETSPVVETRYGFHIIRRPQLNDVRDNYTRVVRDTLYWRMRDADAAELVARHDVRIEDDAPEIMRRAGAQPNRGKQSRERIGRYQGGEFTAADFVRWLQVLEIDVHEGISQSGDGELGELAKRLIRYDLEWQAAEQLGIMAPDSVVRAAKQRLARDIRDLRQALNLDATWVETESRDRDAVPQAVATYLTRFAENPDSVNVEVVPPFLADKLRRDGRWTLRYDALDEVVDLVRQLRAADSTAGR